MQDQDNNFTRFMCISKKLEIYPGADRTSLMAVLPHEPGSLYKLLSRLLRAGLNLLKLESRPMPDRDFEFQFYFDLETSVYSRKFAQLMCEMAGICEEFTYLGSYRRSCDALRTSGAHLAHSYSPQIHALLGDYRYELFEVAPETLGAFCGGGVRRAERDDPL